MTRSMHRRQRRRLGLSLPSKRELYFIGRLLYVLSATLGFIASWLTFFVAESLEQTNETIL